MDLIRFQVKLAFSEETLVSTPAKALFIELTGKQHPVGKPPPEPGVNIVAEKDRLKIIWDYDGCSILWEDLPDYRSNIEKTIEILDKIDKVVPIPMLSSRSLLLYWILPIEKLDFQSLELKYRNTFIKQNEIFKNSRDCCVIVDMECRNWTLHHQSGPMKIKQLQDEYRIFKGTKGTPRLFLFLETTIIDSQNTKYSRKDFEKFILESFIECKSHSTDFQRIAEGML